MAGVAIGIDIGGTTTVAALVDGGGATRGFVAVPTPDTATGISDLAKRLTSELMIDDVRAVGIGAAGLVDSSARMLLWGPHLRGGRIPLGDIVAHACGLPVSVDNDANLATLAEMRLGAAVGYRLGLMIVLGTGIGGGIIVDGALYRGRGLAGEFGHFAIEQGGPPCSCGRNGCWERYVSGSRLDEIAAAAVAADPDGSVAEFAEGRPPRGEHLMSAALAGDTSAQAAWNEVGAWLGRGVAQLAAFFDPEVVVVGGGPSAAGDLLLDPARSELNAVLHGRTARPAVPLVAARFRENGSVIGAGLMALEAVHD